jgi:hypothetical protein
MHPRLSLASRRHPLASPRGRLRAAQRLAGGLRPAALAHLEQADGAEVDALLARPDFMKLLAACQALQAMPEAERLRRLEQIAWFVLELALAEGDWRCAAFVLIERRLGRNPASTLARRAVARQRRVAKPPTPATPKAAAAMAAPRSPGPSAALSSHDPATQVVARAGARLRDAVVEEHAVRHAAEEAAAEPANAAAPSPTSTAVPRPRRLDGLSARLRSGTATVVAEPPAATVKGLLRAWAQGP